MNYDDSLPTSSTVEHEYNDLIDTVEFEEQLYEYDGVELAENVKTNYKYWEVDYMAYFGGEPQR